MESTTRCELNSANLLLPLEYIIAGPTLTVLSVCIPWDTEQVHTKSESGEMLAGKMLGKMLVTRADIREYAAVVTKVYPREFAGGSGDFWE